MTADATVGASFAPAPAAKYSLNVAVQGSGRVTSSPAGIDCGSACSASYVAGTAVTLAPSAAAGWAFTGWSGACLGTNGCSIVLNSDASVGASFQQPPPPPEDECSGLLPAALGTPVVATLPRNGCLYGTSDDGTGNYLLGYNIDGQFETDQAWKFYAIQNGSPVNVGDAGIRGGSQTGTAVLSQPSGFSVVQTQPAPGNSVVSWYSHEGVLTSSSMLALELGGDSSLGVGVDPSGGLAVARSYKSGSGWVSEYQRFSKSGEVEAPWVKIDAGLRHAAVAVGVVLSGHALVVEMSDQPGILQARWVERNGAALTGWFSLPQATFSLQFLMDGSLFLGSYRLEDAAIAISNVPAWLSLRSQNRLEVVRNGKGYASWGTQGPCPGELEVIAASGKTCGCLAVPRLSNESSIGRDGSLIVPHADPICRYDLYPQVLR